MKVRSRRRPRSRRIKFGSIRTQKKRKKGAKTFPNPTQNEEAITRHRHRLLAATGATFRRKKDENLGKKETIKNAHTHTTEWREAKNERKKMGKKKGNGTWRTTSSSTERGGARYRRPPSTASASDGRQTIKQRRTIHDVNNIPKNRLKKPANRPQADSIEKKTFRTKSHP